MTRLNPLPLVLALAALAACTQKPGTDAKDSVATINGHPLSRNTFEQYAKGMASKPAEDLSAEQRNQLLDNLIRAEVVAQDAETSGLAARNETRAALDLSRLQILQQAASQDYLKDRQPSGEELQAEYDIQVAQLGKLQYHLADIVLPTEDLAKQITAQLKSGANFAQLAKQKSIDTRTRDNGGDMGWLTPAYMTPEIAAAVEKLNKGDFTAAPIKNEDGWHVIRVIDTRDNTPPPFDKVKDQLVQIVQQKKFKAHVDKLMEQAKVNKTL
jgi:peptidyl-prolyl cis-trans isomerase C